MNKYNAQSTIINGIKFDSKFESKVYQALLTIDRHFDAITVSQLMQELKKRQHFLSLSKE